MTPVIASLQKKNMDILNNITAIKLLGILAVRISNWYLKTIKRPFCVLRKLWIVKSEQRKFSCEEYESVSIRLCLQPLLIETSIVVFKTCYKNNDYRLQWWQNGKGPWEFTPNHLPLVMLTDLLLQLRRCSSWDAVQTFELQMLLNQATKMSISHQISILHTSSNTHDLYMYKNISYFFLKNSF